MKPIEEDLKGKTVAITGASGGLGEPLCRAILDRHGRLIAVDRNPQKAERLCCRLRQEFPDGQIVSLLADFERLETVETLCEDLEALDVDILIHNAGAYAIPDKRCRTGYNAVFQINCASPYYITKRLLPCLEERKGIVIVVGSIAHTYSNSDPYDIDFSTRTSAGKVYGNAKRYVMFSHIELLKEKPDVQLSVTHPGISFTNITAHYPPWLFAIIKHPMKWLFMKPMKAIRSIGYGIAHPTKGFEWIGPRFFNVWGEPSLKPLKTVSAKESQQLFKRMEAVYEQCVLTVAHISEDLPVYRSTTPQSASADR